MSDKVAIVKIAANVITSAGVWKVVSDTIRNNVTIETPVDAIKVWSGTLVLGSLVATHATNHVNERIDQAIEWYEGRKDEMETDKSEAPG